MPETLLRSSESVMSSVPVRKDMRYRKDLGRGIRKMRARRPIMKKKSMRVRYARAISTGLETLYVR